MESVAGSSFFSVPMCTDLFRSNILLRVAIVSGAIFFALSDRSHLAAEIEFKSGIEYARPDGQSLKLNMARPETADLRRLPAVVCIHGGGFVGGDRSSWDSFVRKLASCGYIAVTIDYRLAPKYQWPAQIHDCNAAVRWLRAHADRYGIDAAQIGVMGNSAGGHLAQFMGVTSDVPEFRGTHTHLDYPHRVQCVAAWSQASDFTREYGIWDRAGEVFKIFLGKSLTTETRRLHVRASPLFWVTPNATPSIILHGTRDPEVLFAQSVWIYDRLVSAEVDVKLVPLEGAGHSFSGKYLEKASASTIRFFDAHLKKVKAIDR